MVASVTLPDGFVLDQSAAPAAVNPSLPPGFQLDNANPPPGPAQPSYGNPPLNSLQDYGKMAYGWNDYPKRSAMFPIAEDAEGKTHFAMPQVGVDMLNNILLPGFAARGGNYTPSDTLGLAAMISPMSPASRGVKAAEAVVPTTDELKKAASSGYDAARDMGVTYSSDAVKQMADSIENSLTQEGRISELNPETFSLLKKLQDPPDGSFVTLDALQALRKRFGDVAGSPDRAKSAAASIAIGKLDDFLESGGVGSQAGALAGPTTSQGTSPAEQAAAILKNARGNSAAAFRANDVADLEDTANMRASANNSGRNLGNSIRQRLASLLSSEGGTRGYSPEEVDAMRQIVDGTTATNTLRSVSNKLGAGGGLGQTFLAGMGGAAGYHFGPEAAAAGAMLPMAVGSSARSLGNSLTEKQLTAVQDLIRQRSPLYADRLANPGTVASSPMAADAARRAALVNALQGYQNPTPTGTLDPNML